MGREDADAKDAKDAKPDAPPPAVEKAATPPAASETPAQPAKGIVATGKQVSDGRERRRHPRTPVKAQVVVMIERFGELPLRARIRDLSRSGMGLDTAFPLRRGEEFLVRLTMGGGRVCATCRTANCRLADDDRYRIGAEFIKIERDTSPEVAAEDDGAEPAPADTIPAADAASPNPANAPAQQP